MNLVKLFSIFTFALTIMVVTPNNGYACGIEDSETSCKKSCKEKTTKKCCSSDKKKSCGKKCGGNCGGECGHKGCKCSTSSHVFGLQPTTTKLEFQDALSIKREAIITYKTIFYSNLYSFVWLPPKIS